MQAIHAAQSECIANKKKISSMPAELIEAYELRHRLVLIMMDDVVSPTSSISVEHSQQVEELDKRIEEL